MSPIGFHSYPSGFPPKNEHKPGRHHITMYLLDWFSWLTKGRSYPHPHVWDFAEESQLLMRFFVEFWKLIVIALGTIVVLILFFLALIRVAMVYDRYTSRHGAMGTQLSKREDAMVRACEKRGRSVMARMEKERLDRIWAETERRQAAREEHLRRKSIPPGKLPLMSRIGEEPIEGVGEGPAPKPSLERSKSKREERRGDGTQVFSQEEDDLRRRIIPNLPAGAEAKIGNSVWRSMSAKTIHRTNSQPSVYYSGSFRTLLGSLPARGTELNDGSDDDGHVDKHAKKAETQKATKFGSAGTVHESQAPFLRRLSFEFDDPEILDVPGVVVRASSPSQVDDTTASASTETSSTTSSSSGISLVSPMPTRIPGSIRSPILDATPYVSPDEASPLSLESLSQSHSICSANSSPAPSHDTQVLASDRLLREPSSLVNTPYHTPYHASSLSLATDHLLGPPLSPTLPMNAVNTAPASVTSTQSSAAVKRRSPSGSVAASIDTLYGRIERLRLGRLSFEVPGGWEPVEISPLGSGRRGSGRDGGNEEDREEDDGKGHEDDRREEGGGWWPW